MLAVNVRPWLLPVHFIQLEVTCLVYPGIYDPPHEHRDDWQVEGKCHDINMLSTFHSVLSHKPLSFLLKTEPRFLMAVFSNSKQDSFLLRSPHRRCLQNQYVSGPLSSYSALLWYFMVSLGTLKQTNKKKIVRMQKEICKNNESCKSMHKSMQKNPWPNHEPNYIIYHTLIITYESIVFMHVQYIIDMCK